VRQPDPHHRPENCHPGWMTTVGSSGTRMDLVTNRSSTSRSARRPYAWLMPPSFRHSRRTWLMADIVAGLTLSAVAIPEVMGYTTIWQTPIVTGLYTVIFPAAAFALFGASKLLVVGADSATAAILAAGL